MNAGFIYLDAPGSGIPEGFYTLRASAQPEDLRVGAFPGRVELVSASGEVAANLPASIDAFSLEVPDPLPFPRTTISHDLQRTEGAALTKAFRWRITITIRCPNGTTIRISIGW